MRRRDLLSLLLLLPAGPVLAQSRSRGAGKPPPLETPKLPAQPPAAKSGQLPGFTLAPMPDRTKEGPRVVEQDRTRINPSIINKNMPGRGQAQEGSPDLLEDKLFRPAPGVRLNAPFSY